MSERPFKSWPGDDRGPRESKPCTVETPDSCPLCGDTDFDLLPSHLRNDCPGGSA